MLINLFYFILILLGFFQYLIKKNFKLKFFIQKSDMFFTSKNFCKSLFFSDHILSMRKIIFGFNIKLNFFTIITYIYSLSNKNSLTEVKNLNNIIMLCIYNMELFPQYTNSKYINLIDIFEKEEYSTSFEFFLKRIYSQNKMLNGIFTEKLIENHDFFIKYMMNTFSYFADKFLKIFDVVLLRIKNCKHQNKGLKFNLISTQEQRSFITNTVLYKILERVQDNNEFSFLSSIFYLLINHFIGIFKKYYENCEKIKNIFFIPKEKLTRKLKFEINSNSQICLMFQNMNYIFKYFIYQIEIDPISDFLGNFSVLIKILIQTHQFLYEENVKSTEEINQKIDISYDGEKSISIILKKAFERKNLTIDKFFYELYNKMSYLIYCLLLDITDISILDYYLKNSSFYYKVCLDIKLLVLEKKCKKKSNKSCVLKIDRKNIWKSTLRELRKKKFFKSRYEVSFIGEKGLDGGGLTNEWLLLLFREITNPDKGNLLRLIKKIF